MMVKTYVTLKVGDKEITLSPMSYIDCSYLNLLSYYDKESDTYEIIELNSNSSTVLVETKYMTIDVSSDEIIYKDDFTMLINNFSSLPKLVDNIENSGASN